MYKKLLGFSVLLLVVCAALVAHTTPAFAANSCYTDSAVFGAGKPPAILPTCDYAGLQALGYNMGNLPSTLDGCYYWPGGNAPGEVATCGDPKFANAQTIDQIVKSVGATPVVTAGNSNTDNVSGTTTTGTIAATAAPATDTTTPTTAAVSPESTSPNSGAAAATNNGSSNSGTPPAATPPGEVVNPVKFNNNTNKTGYVCGGGEGNEVTLSIDIGCKGQGNAILDALFAVIRFLTAGVGLVVVGSIVVGGIQYTASQGDPQAVAKAKERIASSVVALLFFMFIYAILNWLIPAGLLK